MTESKKTLFFLVIQLLVFACGGDDDVGNDDDIIEEPPLESIELDRSSITLEVTDRDTLDVITDIDDLTVSWESSDPEVVTVGASGELIAKNSGSATITATVEGIQASCQIIVDRTVFIIGNEETDGYEVGKLWKNGVEIHELKDDILSVSASVMDVFDGDIHILYTTSDDNGNAFKLRHWVNGESTSVSSSTYAYPTGIHISDEGNYFLFTEEEFETKTILQKNGIDNTVGYGYAGALFIEGTDEYVVYKEYDDNFIPQLKLWNNGDVSDVSDGTRSVDAFGMFVDNMDVFVAGYEYNGSNYIATIWKNGLKNHPSASSNNISFSQDIVIHDGNVFVVGRERKNGTYIAKIWKDGVVTDLTDGTNPASASAIYVFENDVYVIGYETENYQIGKLWINGEAQDLSDGTTNVYLTDIIVK